MPEFNDARVRKLNAEPVRQRGQYVVYWMQMFRRLNHNHALDYAIAAAKHLKKPLVVYEALKLNYPWASARIHSFVLEGMQANAGRARKLGLNYWPFVETPDSAGRGLVKKLAADAAMIVTDDYPAYIVPAHNRAIAKLDLAVHAVDANGVVPLSLLGKPVAAAAHLRPRIHKLFAESWANRSKVEPEFDGLAKTKLEAPLPIWDLPADLPRFVAGLPIDQSVPPVLADVGGTEIGRQRLHEFVRDKLPRYAAERSQPDDPERNSASGLSAHLHFGHLGIEEVIDATLNANGPWDAEMINPKTRNKDDFFCRDPNVNSFLDEAITWRDIGHHWSAERGVQNAELKTKSWQTGETPSFNFETMDFSPLSRGTLERVLPPWAWATLNKHAGDRREYVYSLEHFENADTHDELWNAAQTELVKTGRIHNYLRMLWGKKVLEWSASPEEAYRVLEHLNNKYALDGRDPNSYSGILWCFGLFDRPWPPEREVFGSIRYMSSANTAKKFKLAGYYEYIRRLDGRVSDPAGQAGRLF
ncbi:MAG: deoxyribodipyrimidine photolyase [Gemmataceae bacterium]|nr:deoxyribodipyrimidine photolyase [Gemmataceae bacterium]